MHANGYAPAHVERGTYQKLSLDILEPPVSTLVHQAKAQLGALHSRRGSPGVIVVSSNSDTRAAWIAHRKLETLSLPHLYAL